MQYWRIFRWFLLFTLICEGAIASAQNKVVDEAYIRAMLTDFGRADIVITIQVNGWQKLSRASAAHRLPMHLKIPGQKDFGPDSRLTEAIRESAEAISSALPVDSFNLKKTFKIVPAMALTVDSNALQLLIDSPGVVRIMPDRPTRRSADDISANAESNNEMLNNSTLLVEADKAWNMGFSGQGIYIAVLDTGIRTTHEMFAGKTLIEACFSTTGDHSISVCPNGEESQIGPGAAADVDGHGTHVAGIAAGNNTDYSPGEAQYGIAPEADLMAVQVFSYIPDWTDYGALISDQISGLEYVYSQRNAIVIGAVNMSLGAGNYDTYCDSDPRKPIIDLLRQAGIATVISTGNDGYCGFVSSPACISSAIAVGASDKSDTEAYYSNWHLTLQGLYAPGSSILSPTYDGDSSYAAENGTSMAAPHVAGAFAILRQSQPKATVEKMETVLKATGVDILGSCTGAGTIPRINVSLALRKLNFPWLDLVQSFISGGLQDN